MLFILTQCDGCKRKEYQQHKFPSTLIVENYTDHHYADTMAMIVLDKVFNIDTLTLEIYYFDDKVSKTNYDINGFIIQVPFDLNRYIMFIKRGLSDGSLKTLISHEMIHVDQIKKGELIPIPDYQVIYLGDTVDLTKTPYEQRRFEIDARRAEKSVIKRLNTLLYK